MSTTVSHALTLSGRSRWHARQPSSSVRGTPEGFAGVYRAAFVGDARPLVAMAEADPVLRPLVRAAPGLRPPLFGSAYEALAWAVLPARRPRAQMVAVREAPARHACGRSSRPAGSPGPRRTAQRV
jgi:hypothetical protein